MSAHQYPVRVDAALETPLSRWLWLVKWLLALPHLVVLVLLWVAFVVLSVVAFFAILLTGRYPRSIFDFNVGVLRWTWRVDYYTYGGLGTDHYPPFSLAERPDYPAHLVVEYPERLSRGLVLVKWWLLAIPHYVVAGIFVGGGFYVATGADGASWGVGLIGVLVLVAAVVLLFTGSYPRPIFDLVLGLNRWVLRVAAYVALMTDEYPPFRLDQGGTDPGTAVLTGSGTAGPSGPETPPTERVPRTGPAGRWTGGRVLAVVAGCVLALTSFGLLVVGGGALIIDAAARDDDGYLTSAVARVDSDGHAVVSESVELPDGPVDVTERWLGTVEVRATARPAGEVFVGIARTADVDAYLAGVSHSVVTEGSAFEEDPELEDVAGDGSVSDPASEEFWVASASGAGTQTLTWEAEDGEWTLVVMQPSGAAPVSADVRLAATVPALDELGVGLLVAGAVLGVLAVVLVVAAQPRQRAG